MPTPVTLNGVVYQIPVQGDQRWAPPLTRYLIALASATLQPTGGSFTLTGDANFGASFGLLAAYFSGRGTVASSGLIRLAKTDTIDWRNNAGIGNNILSTDSSDNLVYNGIIVPTGLAVLADGKIWIGSAGGLPVAQILTGDVTVSNAGLTSIGALKIVNAQISNSAAITYSKLNLSGSITNTDIYVSAAIAYSKLALSNSVVNADINASAAIDYSKLATLTASKVLVSDGSGIISASSITNATLAFLDATSSIQGQLNGKQATLTTGNLTELTSNVLTIGGGTGAVIGSGTTITVTAATDSVPGYMTAADHTALTNVISSDSGKLPLTGGTLTGDLILANQHSLILKELTANGTTAVTLRAPATVTGSYTMVLPPAVAGANQVLTDVAGNGILSWATPSNSGIVNAGTQYQLAYYATSTNAVSGLTLITASRALASDVNGLPVASATTATELNYVNGVTSAIQTQFTGKRANFSNGQLPGTITNDSASAGNVGEYIQAINNGSNAPTSTQYGDLTSISLTAGDWDVTAGVFWDSGGATWSTTGIGISTTSGNSAAGLNGGENYANQVFASSSTTPLDLSFFVPVYRMSLASTTTIYLKYRSTYTGGPPTAQGRLSARRVR